jgi:arylsulfatase A-like enzyme/Tfp pilus assembly protein PilF
VRALLLSFALAFASAAQTPASGQESPSDIVLITVDTLRRDYVGCYEHSRTVTPAIDSLCRDGIRFDQAITAAPITNTSHASILTGLLPSQHGVSDFGIPLGAQHHTIAEQLKARGYQTAAFIGAVILDSTALAPGFNRGFDTYDNFPSKGDHWTTIERRAEVVVQHASNWLKQHASGKRFIWVHLYDPHDPYEPPAPFSTRFGKDAYGGEIAYADAQIAKLVALLKAQGRYGNSAIFLLSDHGEGLGDHGEKTHGIFLYDSTLRIPLIAKLPKNRRAGTTVPEEVSTTDILPSIAEIAGAPVPAGVGGKSLLSAFKAADRVVISETDYPLRFGWAPIKSARTVADKYIDAPRPEYYDLHSDPGETKNIYAPWTEQVQERRAEIAQHRRKNPPGAPPVPASTVNELQALGYLGTVVGSTTAADLSSLPDPKDKIEVQNLIHHGMMAQDRGRVREARDSFSKAVALDQQSPNALLLLGTAELKDGAYEQAAAHLQSAAALRPDDAAVATAYGEALYRTGDLQHALGVLQKAATANPGLYRVRALLGEIFLKQNALDQAADQLEAAILIDPAQAPAYITFAKVRAAQGDIPGAQAQLSVLLKSDPNNTEAKQLLESLKRSQ